MDVTFSNVLEGTRQYFMGLPKQAANGGAGGGGGWTHEEGEPAQSGAPTPSARPPSAAGAPQPPRPPSEPLEPEPHIIHKATVMREAAEKRRERPEPDEEEEPPAALSPPSHVIHRPAARALPSPARCPSPARPPSAAPDAPPVPDPAHAQYQRPVHRGHTPTSRPPELYTPGRPPDTYSVTRPPEHYARYHYESSGPEGVRSSHGHSVASPQPPMLPRHSPQTYARLSSSMPQHAASRLRDSTVHSPPAQRFAMPPAQPPPPPNDRVPPIHHPQAPSLHRAPPVDSRPAQYPPIAQRREPSPYSRTTAHYDRHPALPQRKYDPQQAYPGYRPTSSAPQSMQSHRVDQHHPVQYKHTLDAVSAHYARPLDRAPASAPAPSLQQSYLHEVSRHPQEMSRRPDYANANRSVDARSSYHYPTPSTSTVRTEHHHLTRCASSAQGATVHVVPSSTLPAKAVHRPATAPKSSYDFPTSNHVPTSPARSTVKPGYPNQQARMTVSVTSLVNQMNQTKQKRESPLDLSVKTVKNSADSSTTQDDMIDSATVESKALPLQSRPTSSSRHVPATSGFVESHKVDFAPDFTQYRERNTNHAYATPAQVGPHPVKYNGGFELPRPVAEAYPLESRHTYPERSKFSVPSARTDYVPRIDLTRSIGEERRPDNRIRDDRHFIIEERKRPTGPIVNNIPEKIVRYETWSADSRISDRMTQSAREQHELMSRPVYSYSSHKQFEAYQNEQKRAAPVSVYRDHSPHVNHRYPPYPAETTTRERTDYHAHHHDRNPSSSNRHVIQKIPSHRDMHSHHLDPHSGIPADKRVLSILRNSLETKQTGYVEPVKQAKQVPDLIVIDDVDDSVIEITDLTKDNDMEASIKSLPKPVQNQIVPTLGHQIQMPKAVDSIPRDSDYQKFDGSDSKSKSPENDVASRIRTKAELKVLPPSHDTTVRNENKQTVSSDHEQVKLLPKSQKQHLFNQMRQDNLRFESVIKSEKCQRIILPEVKSEPMNIDEIEKDAVVPIKTENVLEDYEPECVDSLGNALEVDLDWANACDSFMEQLKSGCHKKKTHRKRIDTVDNEIEIKADKVPKLEPIEPSTEKQEQQPPTSLENSIADATTVVVKQEPIDEDEILNKSGLELTENQRSETSKSMSIQELCIKDKVETKQSTSVVGLEVEKGHNIISKTSSSIKVEEKEKEKSSTKNISTNKESNEKNQVKKDKNAAKAKKSSKVIGRRNDQTKSKRSSHPERKENEETKIKKSSMTTETNDKNKDEVKTKQCTVDISIKKVDKLIGKNEKNKFVKRKGKINEKSPKDKIQAKPKIKQENTESSSTSSTTSTKFEVTENESIKSVIKEELESTDDDEPLIKSKLLKEKEMKYQLLKDLSEKSAYVKLECFDVDMNKNTRISIDSLTKDKDEKLTKGKITRQTSRTKAKSLSVENIKREIRNEDTTSDSDDDLSVASRLRLRKHIKTEDIKATPVHKTPVKSSPTKKQDNSSNSSTPIRKTGFGDGSDFHPGWEEELYRYKRSLRMPTRLIAIPRGGFGGPFVRGSGGLFTRGSTSLPDLDPAPLSPAPSSAPSAATDDLYARRPDKLPIDSDLDSNSSCSAANRLQYDSEASTSTVFSSKVKKKSSSIVDVLIKKCGKKDDSKKKVKDKDDKTPKIIPKSSNATELLPTPSLGLLKNGNKGSLSAKKEKLMEDIFYLGAFRKETVTAFRNAFINNTDGLIGATEEFAPVVLKSRTRTESRVLKHRATIKEVFGDERPASAPPMCRDNEEPQEKKEQVVEIKKEPKEPDSKPKLKSKKLLKKQLMRRSNSIRDGLRSTSLKRNDAKGRLLRLKKRNNLMISLAGKKMKGITGNKIRKEKAENALDDPDKSKEGSSIGGIVEDNTKRRLKRLFGRRKFSSGFDYIRKKKKIIRRDNTPNNKIRRPAVKPSPESVHDIQKEVKGWFINKSVGETHLHRSARLGYTDCVAYCLEKMEADPSAKDNAGFTPLHFASAKGHVRIARLLLQYGANVSAAAQGGVRPLHEACENSHVEMIRLLLAYGADPLLGTYAGQTPEELTEGPAARLLRLHIADVQGKTIEPWRFPAPGEIIDRDELGCDPLSSPPPSSPPPPPDSMVEIQCTEAPLPPFYSLRTATGQAAEGLWCLLQDVTNLLQIKSKESLLKQIHCGSGSPKELLREIRTQEFLERAQCHQLLGAGEKVNVRASKVSLVRVTDKLRQLLKIETVLVS